MVRGGPKSGFDGEVIPSFILMRNGTDEIGVLPPFIGTKLGK